jgi:anaerobic magnesium-protoporphyrin IX monomethyl ester cyclase
MKVMLISPPNTLDNSSKEESSFENRITPLDMAIIGAVLEKEGHTVKILDALAKQLDKDSILKEITDFTPELICLTTFDRCRWGIAAADELSRNIKLDGKIRLGLIWSYRPNLMISLMEKNPNIDFSIYGDPEFTLLDIANNKSYEGIKGVIHRKKSEIITNPPREPITSLDELPFPARHLLDSSAYKRLPHELIREPCFDIIASRGCPYQCIFCLLNVVWGGRLKVRSPEKVIEEIKYLKEQGARQLHFHDLTFTIDREWVMKLCDLLIQENLDLIWVCQTRVDKVDLELLQKMKKAGCRSILYGIESFVQESLDTIKKGVKIEDVERALELTRKVRIEARCSVMLGLPGETKESVEKTISLLLKWNPAFVQFHTTIAFPGTELYNNVEKYGKIIGNEMARKFDVSGNPFVPNGYKDENELLEMQKKAYRSFYLRPRYIFGKIFNIKEFGRNIRGIKLFLKLTSR